jgi:hypothetical protein
MSSDPKKEKEPKQQPWWQTMPGIMTGMAAVLTAFTGLLIALGQIGVIGSGTGSKTSDAAKSKATVLPAASSLDTNATATTAAPGRPTPGAESFSMADMATQSPGAVRARMYPITLAAGGEAKVGQEASYKILAAQLNSYGGGKVELDITVRFTNLGKYPANFWDRSFRLIIDDVPLAPESGLDEVVDGGSAKEGKVIFVIPENSQKAVLQVGEVGNETNTIPLQLKPTTP